LNEMTPRQYSSIYSNSRALVVGIDAYKKVAPLSYAVSDASGVADALRDSCGFPQSCIEILADQAATKMDIAKRFLSLVQNSQEDDRIIFFFAGHGCTVQSRRGEVGFLVPVDGDINDLASLIRWDELTRNSELIPAKHMLFIMDACYSGLVLMRSPSPGGKRFLRDTMRRYSRQVITAGKADEKVADSGGPRAGHSVFTGHMLDGIMGKAETVDGILTASGLMSFTYEHVAKDANSRQTPSFGCIAGEGDMVLRGFPQTLDEATGPSEDIKLIPVPTPETATPNESPAEFTDEVKQLLSEPSHIIRLHDLMTREVRSFQAQTSEDLFGVDKKWDPGELIDRIARYEVASKRLLAATTLIARWGTPKHRGILQMIMSHSLDRSNASSGTTGWLNLRAYPCALLMYVGGVASVVAGDYGNMAALLDAKVTDSWRGTSTVLSVLSRVLYDLQVLFKDIPERNRKFFPFSEYMIESAQPMLDDLLFLGERYEEMFDRFEVMLALLSKDVPNRLVMGRFAWKHWNDVRQGTNMYPFNVIKKEAETAGQDWPPLRAGLFGGSIERLARTINDCEEILQKEKLGW
jgi:hypothetical protein